MDEPEPDYRAMYEQVSRLSDRVFDQALSLKAQNELLEERVRQRTEELEQANLDAMYMLATAAEAHDSLTGEHVRRVELASYSAARALGFDESRSREIGRSSVLHDVGKLFISIALITKEGPLTPDERTAIEQHTLAGERLIADRPFFACARTIARSHHENVDGTGYPDGLSKDQIPIEARIVRVTDCCDALLSTRPYKDAWPLDRVYAYLRTESGTMFDKDVVKAYLQSRKQPLIEGQMDWII